VNQPTIQDLLEAVETCLRDASVRDVSPRCRFHAAQDAAVLATITIARIDGNGLGKRNQDEMFAYLRNHSSACTGLGRHILWLSRFDRDDYDSSYHFTHADANRALVSAVRIHTALRWMLQRQQREDHDLSALPSKLQTTSATDV
jgi:hypothetical protein